jgi:eukaryotic translation initiation factor 2C
MRDFFFFFVLQLCKIAAGQRYPERLNVSQVTNFLKATCQWPQDREDRIKVF